jgi:proteasome lid subunit RPN8/RPN11
MADPNSGNYSQRLEARRIEASAGIIAGSLNLESLEDSEILEFDIASEPTVNPPIADIRAFERICFVYRQGRRFGETGPSHVLCKREDFPRDLVHLCAREPGELAAPCLALGGLQPLYERAGIEAILERLRKFLRDAKTGSLTADGWEPVPFGVNQKPCHGEVVPHFFQDFALGHLQVGSAIGLTRNIEEGESRFARLYPGALPPENVSAALAAANEDAPNGHIPWVFLWPTDIKPESEPIFADWRTGKELHDGMTRIGVSNKFSAVVGDLITRDISFRCKREPQGGKGLIVVLGIWRQQPIMQEFFGYSENPEARRLELRAFRVSQRWDKQIVADDTQVETIVGDYLPAPELFRWVAGVERIPSLAMIGNGALGSAIFDQMARSGMEDAIVYDSDVLRPHNLTRHTGGLMDLYQPKAEQASKVLKSIARENEIKIATAKQDIVDLAMEELVSQVEGRLVIDATADERVRLRMDELREAVDVTVVRTEMFHEGRLGLTFVAPPNGPTLADMMHALVATAPHDKAIAAWLENEERYPLGPDPLLAGFGCTSQTIHLPVHVVQQQASVATSAILGDLGQPGVLINPLDSQFRPTGSRWLPIDAFSVFVPPTEDDWRIRIAASAISLMINTREEALPSETGGYLYGTWDPIAKLITVTNATPLPPESDPSPTSLQLGPAGTTAEERRLVLKTRNRTHLCGTWHSHPDGSARMSGRDHKTLMAHHAKDRESLSPTLVVIVANEEIQTHLKLP